MGLLSLLLAPPVLLLAGIVILAVYARWLGQKGLFRAGLVLAGLYYLASAPASVNSLARVIAVPEDSRCTREMPGATVVVMTGGATGSARTSSEVWRLDQATFRRLVFAVNLAKRQPGSSLLITGGAEVGLTNEARISEQLVNQMGWPDRQLLIEEVSTDTYTSAGRVAGMLQPGSPLLLVTSDLHMRRAAYAYRKAGLHPITCSVPDPDALVLPDSVLPNAGALAKFSQAWKELLGLMVYSIRDPPIRVTG